MRGADSRARIFALLAAALVGRAAGAEEPSDARATPSREAIEEILITARKRPELLQDVPIAVTAVTADDLARSNIDDLADLQLAVPNLHFSKTSFQGAGIITIRGVGSLVVAPKLSQLGVAVHVNDAPFVGARVFETEFFDVESAEVLRGPQGTLFGGNATGGSVNLSMKEPVFRERGGFLAAEYGSYNHAHVEAALNVPLGEHFAARIGGYYFRRDGLTQNLNSGRDIDDRELYQLRGSLAGDWDDVEFNLMLSYFREDDSRMRINKQACTTDPRPWPYGIGCQPGADVPLRREPINEGGSLGYAAGILIDTFHVLGPVHNALLADGQPGLPFFPNRPVVQTPRFLSGPVAALTPFAAPDFFFDDGYLISDANGDALFGARDYGTPTQYYAGSVNPRSLRKVNTQLDPQYVTDELMLTFVVNWDVAESVRATAVTGYHQWYNNSRSDYWLSTPAVRFDGGPRTFDFPDSAHHSPWKDLAGSYSSEFPFDRAWAEGNTFTQELRVATHFDGPLNATLGVSYSRSRTKSEYAVWAASLEALWDMPDVVWTCAVAAAYIEAHPGSSCHDALPRASYYFNEQNPSLETGWALFGELYWDVLEHTHVMAGARYTDNQIEVTDRVNLWFCEEDLSTSAPCDPFPFGHSAAGFHGLTWKVGISQEFDLAFAADSLVYLTVSRGYKGGGFNPPIEGVDRVIGDEALLSYEVGYKGVWFDRLGVRVTSFYYDYEDMQIPKAHRRAIITENADAESYGIELETIYKPSDAMRFDLSVGWLRTKLLEFDSIDLADPTADRPGWTTLKELLPYPLFANVICNQAINPLCVEGTPSDIFDFSDGYLPDGFSQSFAGNELPASPEFNVKAGAEVTLSIGRGWQATPRLDFAWQAESWGRAYNAKRDEIGAWHQLDAQLTLVSPTRRWSIELWGKNLQDNDDVTGHFLADEGSALFTNLFILEPRTFGATIRCVWGESES